MINKIIHLITFTDVIKYFRVTTASMFYCHAKHSDILRGSSHVLLLSRMIVDIYFLHWNEKLMNKFQYPSERLFYQQKAMRESYVSFFQIELSKISELC